MRTILKLDWNRDLKKFALVFGAVMLVGVLGANCFVARYCGLVRVEYNSMLASMFGNVMEVYPDVREEELVKALNLQGNEEAGRAILASYGIFAEYGNLSFASQERLLLFLGAGTNLVLVLLCLACGISVFFYLGRRQERIRGLASYMHLLERERYSLEIEDNRDDELSSLRNEIYKLTVLLREQAVRAAEQKKALADSVANISHQLKTPLTSVTVLMDNLSENPDMDQETRRHFLSEITLQITGMSWLIATMLKLSRLDAGVVELRVERIQVAEMVRSILGRLELAAEWKEVSFAAEIPEDVGFKADRRWTGEALLNIVKNAVEYSHRGGIVEISAEENDIYTQITVRDYGEGITEEERKKLFERFYNRSSAREDSMGIGLALAKEVVERQNGYISVASKAGEGTVFVLRFLRQ